MLLPVRVERVPKQLLPALYNEIPFTAPLYVLIIHPTSSTSRMSICTGPDPFLLAYLEGYFNDSKSADKNNDGSQTCRMMAFVGNEPSS